MHLLAKHQGDAAALGRFIRATFIAVAISCPASQLFLAVAVWSKQQWMLYALAAPCSGVLGHFAGVQLPLTAWWAADGNKGWGNALFSGFVGVGAPIYTLLFGGFIDVMSTYDEGSTASPGASGLATGLIIVAALSAVVAGLTCFLVLRGWLVTFAEAKQRSAEVEVLPADDPVPLKQEEAARPAPGASQHPPGAPKMSLTDMATTFDFYLVLTFTACYSFVGMGSTGESIIWPVLGDLPCLLNDQLECKSLALLPSCATFAGLLSFMFEKIFELSYLESFLLAALSLTVFALVRFIIPWGTDRINTFLVVTLAGAIDTVIFGALQTIINASRSPWAFFAVKLVTGGIFACFLSLMAIVPADSFGVHNLPTLARATYPTMGVGMALGIVTGHLLGTHGLLQAEAEGSSYYNAFKEFFYTCSGVMGACFVCATLLYLRGQLRKRRAGNVAS